MSAVIELFKDRLGYIPSNIRVSEEGRAARATIKCHCGSDAKISACSDVGGIWIDCPKCGFEDIG